jgi:hypothetical protein
MYEGSIIVKGIGIGKEYSSSIEFGRSNTPINKPNKIERIIKGRSGIILYSLKKL